MTLDLHDDSEMLRLEKAYQQARTNFLNTFPFVCKTGEEKEIVTDYAMYLLQAWLEHRHD